jgi:serine/threonine-protein phosphatase 2A activator
MYKAEVLGKLPVVQHFLFGSILPYDGPEAPKGDVDDAHRGHAHGQKEMGWGDCCGIPVPSVFAAARAELEKKEDPGVKLSGPGIRPVPFD